MMQKVQRWSQPFCTCTKARVCPRWRRARQRDLFRRHDVADRDAFVPPPGLRRQLFFIADHAVDFRHGGKTLRIGLRRAAGDDDAGAGCARRNLRIAWRAWRTASPVTAQVLTTVVLASPRRRGGSPRIRGC
jgi:hypothetical protein